MAEITARREAAGKELRAVYAGRSRTIHLMRGRHRVAGPVAETVMQLLFFFSNPLTLCGKRVSRDVAWLFEPREASCRECARRAGIR